MAKKKRKTKRHRSPRGVKPRPEGVTTEQIEAILNVLKMLIDHADRVASKAQLGVVAVRDLLVRKGIVTEDEWDTAADRVEREHATLFALDPDVQSAVSGACWRWKSEAVALRMRAARHDRRPSAPA